MQQTVNIALNPKEASSEKDCILALAKHIGIIPERIKKIRILKKSIDARHRDISINMNFQVFIDEVPELIEKPNFEYQFIGNKEPVIIVGAGSWYFCSLKVN